LDLSLDLADSGEDALHTLKERHRHRHRIAEYEAEGNGQHVDEWMKWPVPFDNRASQFDQYEARRKTDQSRANHLSDHMTHGVEKAFDQIFDIHMWDPF